jgi:hypothetical protein
VQHWAAEHQADCLRLAQLASLLQQERQKQQQQQERQQAGQQGQPPAAIQLLLAALQQPEGRQGQLFQALLEQAAGSVGSSSS